MLNILIVEDELIVAKYLKQLIIENGISDSIEIVSSYEDVIQAYDNLNKSKSKNLIYEVVLMDIELNSEKDGIEIAQYLNDLYNICLIYTTAYTDEKLLNRAKHTFPAGYLVKPIDPQSFTSTLKMLIFNYEEKILKESKTRFLCDELYLDREQRVLVHYKDNKNKIILTCQEFKFLDLLSSTKGKIFTAEEIEEYIHSGENVTSGSLRTLVYRLRKKLHSINLIQNIQGLGYKI